MLYFSSGVGSSSGDLDVDGATSRRGLDRVPQHDQHAAQIQQTAQQTQHVEREGGLHRFDEGVGQGAVGVDSAPHQTLHHTGDPHGGDVQNDADGGRPEVDFNGLDAVNRLLAEQ